MHHAHMHHYQGAHVFIVLIVPLCHDFDDLEVTVGKLVRLDSYDCIRQRHHYDI